MKKIKMTKTLDVGTALRWARYRELKMTRTELGKILGYSRKEIIKFEYGRIEIPIETLTRIFTIGLKNLKDNS